MKPTAQNNQTPSNLSYSLGAALVEEDILGTPGQAKTIDQDYWGSSMNFNAVREGRIFGVFGVASGTTNSEKRAAEVAA
ncbi:MAG: hypothetical protein AB8B48_00730 [Pseudomonadales bacterium]